ncbi:hypothetical protein FG05_35166 [Fusarium graminearum]|nr:hypothetical protein FG05_35166 [Fusarium graminearum]
MTHVCVLLVNDQKLLAIVKSN